MGNQLVGIAPSQIFPVEHYFAGTFGTELIFDSNMGSTRFFKVAKAKSDEGLVVVKVFVKHDPTLPLEDHKERVEFIKKTLQNAVNCLPFQKVELTDKAAYIMREYVKHSLYDRVSTRPFLTVLEKKWITFQILCALNQCHKQKVCHGDIKLENILITSWNWILLSDFASFKPTYLPEDNPADYTYFFDTSRRRTCYIAPERFVRTLGSDEYLPDSPIAYESMIPSDSLVRLGSYYCGNSLLPSMDIFSAGCALLELWTEGSAPFEFSQLLAYRRGERDLVERHLKGIENENLRDLLSSMIDLNAINRKSAEDYLDQERGNLFPEYFYSFLQSYLQMFSSTPIMSPDDKILRLHSDIEHCITVLKNRPDNFDTLKAEEEEEIEANINESYFCGPEHDGLILIITVVTSCIRGLQHCNTKICCLEILQKLSEYTTSETILDRILPYILHLAQDSSARVQVQAIETLSICLSLVKSIPRSDANVFPEYILPSIASLSTYPSTIVRVAFAKHIAQLAKTAVYFLEETQRNCPNDMSTRRYEAELNALHEILQQTVLSLLIDPQAVVKQTLIESGIHDLCAFFGKAKANDIILSHMITFLNDKEEKNLRGAFFDCIIGVVGYVGWQSSDILIPLLQQGLTDTEEFVIAKAFRATTALVDLGHMQKQTVTEFITESAPFLNHPNLWIRHEVCGLISITAKKLYPIDVQCKIMPAISSHLKCQLIQVEKPEILMDCLYPPIPRNIFDAVLRYSDIYKFIQALEDRMEVRLKIAEGYRTQTDEIGTSLKNLFRRLTTEGLNELIEKQLLSMKSFLIKLSKYKAIEPKTGISGKIILNPKDILYHKYPLVDKPLKTEGTTRKTRRSETDANSNLEWQHIFSGSEVHSPSISSPTLDSGKQTITGTSPTDQSNAPTTSSSLIEYSLPKRISWQERTSECRKDLEKLRTKIKTRYSVLAYNQNYNYEKYNSAYPPGWRMNGTLVAHLHEHSASVIKMTPLKPHGSLFVSGSIDGTVRLWDCNKLNGNQGINKSRQVYLANTPIYSVAACDGGQSLAVGGKDGSLLIMRIDRNSSKMTLQQAIHLVEKERDDGPVVDMQPFDQSSQSVIIYAKLYGAIVAWDTRMQTNAWRLQNELRHGVITAICADPTGSWLATGTSGGKHICWDLRFRLPIAEIKHPSDSWIRKVACHPTEPSCLISSSQSNNEVSVWNIETGHRQTVLWASQSPVLCNSNVQNVSSSTSCGILTGIVDNSPFVLTGSSDHRIRYWDLATPKNSSLIVPSAKDNLSDVSFSYDSRLIDGSRVIAENIISLNSSDNLANMRSSSDENPRSGPDMPSASHHDAITDLLMCKTDKQQTYIVSSARDGVIKIWK